MTWVVPARIKAKVFGYELQQGRRLTGKFPFIVAKLSPYYDR